MTNSKISTLPEQSSPLSTSDVFVVVSSGQTNKLSGSALLAFITSSVTGNVSGSGARYQVSIWNGNQILSGNSNFNFSDGLSVTGSQHRFNGPIITSDNVNITGSFGVTSKSVFGDNLQLTGALGISKNISAVNITASYIFYTNGWVNIDPGNNPTALPVFNGGATRFRSSTFSINVKRTTVVEPQILLCVLPLVLQLILLYGWKERV